jgi:hypothetical protein
MNKAQQYNLLLDEYFINEFYKTLPLTKNAQHLTFQDATSAIKSYIGSHFDKDHPTKSVINLLAPAMVRTIFGGPLGLILGLAMSIFHIDIASILESVYNKLVPHVSNSNKLSSSQVKQVVDESVQEHLPDANTDDVKTVQQQLQSLIFIKLAANSPKLFKSAAGRSVGISLIRKLLTLIFTLILSAGGFMVAGDVANKILGRPNAFDHTLPKQKDKPVEIVSQQTIFPVNSNYQDIKQTQPWIVHITNDHSSIQEFVLSLAKEVYPDTSNLDSIIKNTQGFQYITNYIANYNQAAQGDGFIFIPPSLFSKKEIVDLFIDQVAQAVPQKPILAKKPSQITDKPKTNKLI